MIAHRKPGDVDPMACNELVELVTDYLEGTLNPQTRARFDLHLAGCDGCNELSAAVPCHYLGIGSGRGGDLDPGLRNRLLDAFREWR
jgi:hypothetical protein